MSPPGNGVQYVHWVMHKCIIVKLGGKRNIRRKACKNQVNFSESRGDILKGRGNNNFHETGGTYTETGKIRREIRNLFATTKKRKNFESCPTEAETFWEIVAKI